MRTPSSEQLDRRLDKIMSTTAENVARAQTETKNTAEEEEKKPRKSQADRIIELIKSQNVILFRDELSEPFIRFRVNNHFETWPLFHKKVKRWICNQVYQKEQKTPSPNTVESALSVLAGKASFEGVPIVLFNRAAEDRMGIWYDLTNDIWQAVRITSTGWSIVDHPPILFRRYSHQQAQVLPVTTGGDAKKLLNFVNLSNASDELLLLVYVVSCFIPDIPHPIAVFFGQHGASKTTLGRMIRSIIDPSSLTTLSMPSNANELVQQLHHHWFPFFDNISYISDSISDDLCRAVTGGGFSKRELYSDNEDVIYIIRRPMGLNGINLAVKKPDLLSRSLLFPLSRIPDDKRREEKKLVKEFDEVKPIILAGIFDTLSEAMRIYPSVKLNKAPRMADFAAWGCAIAQALGYSQEDFLKAYNDNIAAQQDHAIQENPVAYAIVQFMDDKTAWEGSMSQLLGELESIAFDERLNAYRSGWPNAANALSHKLNEVQSNLMDRGIFVTNTKSAGVRKVKIEKITKATATTATEISDETIKGIFGDDVIIESSSSSPQIAADSGAENGNRVDGGDVPLPF